MNKFTVLIDCACKEGGENSNYADWQVCLSFSVDSCSKTQDRIFYDKAEIVLFHFIYENINCDP